VYAARQELDRRFCVAQVLSALGAASGEERALVDQYRNDSLIAPRASVSAHAWVDLLFHPEEEVLTGQIFSLIAPAVLVGRVTALMDEGETTWEPIFLPDDPTAVLSPREDTHLAAKRGEDIVTASGTTLLGADDKSGVAVIMAAVEQWTKRPDLAHGPVRVAFTPDEEIGRGVLAFDLKAFGAHCAYTLDGAELGLLETQTFSADSMAVTFQGRNTHPGFAHGVMVNSIKVAADFVSRLPRRELSPETTRDLEGFVHPNQFEATVDCTTVKFIIRDFETHGLTEKEDLLKRLAEDTVRDWPGSSVTFEVKETYRNMRDMLARHPKVVDLAREAIRDAGIAPMDGRIRGGTDGSVLSAMGLPTPNLFTGQHRFHSRLEWISAQDMEASVRVVLGLAKRWAAEKA